MDVMVEVRLSKLLVARLADYCQKVANSDRKKSRERVERTRKSAPLKNSIKATKFAIVGWMMTEGCDENVEV